MAMSQQKRSDADFQFKILDMMVTHHGEVMGALESLHHVGGRPQPTRTITSVADSDNPIRKCTTRAEILRLNTELSGGDKLNEFMSSLAMLGRCREKGKTAGNYVFSPYGLAEMSLTGQKTNKWKFRGTTLFTAIFDAI